MKLASNPNGFQFAPVAAHRAVKAANEVYARIEAEDKELAKTEEQMLSQLSALLTPSNANLSAAARAQRLLDGGGDVEALRIELAKLRRRRGLLKSAKQEQLQAISHAESEANAEALPSLRARLKPLGQKAHEAAQAFATANKAILDELLELERLGYQPALFAGLTYAVGPFDNYETAAEFERFLVSHKAIVHSL